MNTESGWEILRNKREQLRNQSQSGTSLSYERKMDQFRNIKSSGTSGGRRYGEANETITQPSRVNSDAAQYRYNQQTRMSQSRSSHSRTSSTGSSLLRAASPFSRKSESEPGSWPSAKVGGETVRDVATSGLKPDNGDQSVYPKRHLPLLPHSRHHRTDGRKSSRASDTQSGGSWLNDMVAPPSTPEPRRGSEISVKASRRNQVSSSMDNLASSSKHLLLHRHKQRSASPTNTQRPVSLGNLNINSDTITVRLWTGFFVSLDGLSDASLGEALKTHVMEASLPVECIDSNTEEHISWDTPVRNLNRRLLTVREIGCGSVSTVPPSTPGRKVEKRGSSASSDNSKAIQEWYSYFTQHNEEEMSTSELLELRCFLECPPPCCDLDGDHFGLDEHCRSFVMTGKQSKMFAQNCGILRALLEKHRKHLFSLDDNWDDFVRAEKTFTSREHKRQSAIWEVFVTELNYINYLKAILDTYFDPFCRIRESHFRNLDGLKIFSNLEQVYSVNLRLWLGYMHPAYCKYKRNNKPLEAIMLQHGFRKIPRMFIPYTYYCLDLQTCQRYIKWVTQINPTFNSFLKWANHVGSEHREGLVDRVAKPFKRITQYNLMLENVKKFCDDPEEQKVIEQMHKGIGELLKVIDSQMRRVEQSGRMELLERELLFLDCPEKLDENYKQLFDRYKRVPLLEDIELPAPVILTKPQVLFLLRQQQPPNVVDSQVGDVNGLPPVSPLDTSYAYDSVHKDNQDNPDSPSKSGFGDAASNANKQLNRTKNEPHQTDSLRRQRSVYGLPVLLTRWDPPSAYQVSKLNISILDRVRSTRIPAESRRTVPRSLLRKGMLRLREAQGKWTDTTCFLLTDQFIIGKSHKGTSKNHVKVHRPPIRLDKVVVHKPSDVSWFAIAVLDDFNMIVCVYTFHSDKENCDDWCQAVNKAKERYLELMRPEIVYVSSQGTIPPNWFFRKRSPSSPKSQPHQSPTATLDERKNRTLLSLSNSTRENDSTAVKVPYRRPVRPNLFSPPKDSTLMVSDNRARPVQTPLLEGRRTVTPNGQARTTFFFNPTQTGQIRSDSPVTTPNASSATIRTNLEDQGSSQSYPTNSFRRSVRSEPAQLAQMAVTDGLSDVLAELPPGSRQDRVIKIKNPYGTIRLRDESMQSTPDLKQIMLDTPRSELFRFTSTDSHVLNGGLIIHQDRLRAPVYRSTMHIFQGETQSSTTRC